MRILVQRSIPEPLVSPEETWKAQTDPIKLLKKRSRRKRDPVYSYNDKYGFGPCLNHIAGINSKQGIPGILPHGIIPYGKTKHPATAPKQEILQSIPCIFASNDRCREAFLNAGKKFVFPIGLTSTYAHASIKTHCNPSASRSQGSIFFRSHSTPAFTDSLDDLGTIQWLLGLPKRYHPIRISIFPFDWDKGFYDAYIKAGFELVSAGDTYDPAFIWRHLHLILHHRYTLSTGIGTHIFNAIMCQKPVLIRPTKHDYKAHRRDFKQHLEAKAEFQTLCEQFGSPQEAPTRQQIDLARKWLGQEFTLSPKKLRQILNQAQAIHKDSKEQTEDQKKQNSLASQASIKTRSKTNNTKISSTIQPNLEKEPFVSICTLTYNRPDCLKRLLACIEKQTYPLSKIEWLILDDSTDYTEKIHIETKLSFKIKYQKLKHKLTLGAKRNLSHKLCSGEIIVYMDDDDFYFPERVAHAVKALQRSNKEVAGSTYMHIYFSHDDQIWLSGPFGKNHATANTFAMTRSFANHHFYNDSATCNEEKSFLENYTIPMEQLDPLQTLICISHDTNTFDKRRMRQNGPTPRMNPLKPNQARRLKERLQISGFRNQPHTALQKAMPTSSMKGGQGPPTIALISGPWGSGTSALCALIHALGVHAQGPFFQTNDPSTPACFEMLAFNKLVNKLVDETTLERKQTSESILNQLIKFREEYVIKNGQINTKIQLLKTPACSALLPELQEVFSLQLLICLRDLKEIEQSRRRRGWPAHLGEEGAKRIYMQLLNFTASSSCPFLFVRYHDVLEQDRRQLLLNQISRFLNINPSKQQQKQALKVAAI